MSWFLHYNQRYTWRTHLRAPPSTRLLHVICEPRGRSLIESFSEFDVVSTGRHSSLSRILYANSNLRYFIYLDMQANRFFSNTLSSANVTVSNSSNSIDDKLEAILVQLQEHRQILIYGQDQNDEVLSFTDSITIKCKNCAYSYVF